MKTNMLSTSVKNAKRIYAVVRNTMLAAVLTLFGTGMAFAGTNASAHTCANIPLLLVIPFLIIALIIILILALGSLIEFLVNEKSWLCKIFLPFVTIVLPLTLAYFVMRSPLIVTHFIIPYMIH